MISKPQLRSTTRTLTAALALALFAPTGLALAQDAPPPPSAQWEQPPHQFVAAERRGYNDGVHAAREDFDHHRQPDVENSKDYRNPHFMSPADRSTYRSGFREGYQVAVQHIYTGQ